MPFPTLMPMHKRTLCAIRRRFFLLTAYSLTSAAIMGSSIGLVLFQSLQLRILNPYHHNHHRHYHLHYHHHSPHDSSVPSHSQDTPPQSWSSPTTTSSYSLELLQVLHAIWFPLLLWVLSLALASYLGSRRAGLVPEQMSARTGVLMSHGIFAIFWILLGCMQQVQEAVRTSLTAQPSPSSLLPTQDPSRWASPPTVLSPETLNQYQQQQQQDQYQPISTPPSFPSSHLSPEFLLASRTPFWIVWHMAIVLLGLGTGLMTSCAHQLEQDLYAEYYDDYTSVHPPQVPVEKDEGRTSVFTNDQKLWWGNGATAALKEDEQEKCQQHSTLHDSQVELVARSCGLVSSSIAARAPSSTATAAAASGKAGVGSVSIFRSSLLSRGQRVFLAVVLVVLLMAQVWLFQYMVMADYEDSDNADSLLLLQTNIHHNHAYRSKSVQVSSTLATFGLFFGMAMMFIGARILPTPPSSPAGRPYIL